MMRFLVTSRFQLHGIQIPQHYAVISMTDPISPPVVLKEDPMMLAILRLEFYDLDEPIGRYKNVFNHEHADSMKKAEGNNTF